MCTMSYFSQEKKNMQTGLSDYCMPLFGYVNYQHAFNFNHDRVTSGTIVSMFNLLETPYQ